ncbi:hypothetical protein BH10PLA2_BH10PLA2_09250 [soil metagenome]
MFSPMFGLHLMNMFRIVSAILFISVTTSEVKAQGDSSPAPLVWKKKHTLETPGCLPVSVAYARDGKLLIIGGTGGRVVAVDCLTRKEQWKAEVGGDFAAVAVAADGKSVLTTFDDGVRYLDLNTGTIRNFHIEQGSRPIAVGVFPDLELERDMQPSLFAHKILFGNARGWFVKTWTASGFPGTITTTTVPKGDLPADPQAVPLAVDPAGKRVVLTGPRDTATGKNVLWAWAAGNPGQENQILEGHQAAVVSAAWSKDGKTLATGDAAGSVILWDAKSMRPTDHQELGARVAALALSPDGTKVAAVAIGNRAEYFAWEKGKPKNRKLIHIDTARFSGPVHACLAFAPDGQQLVGSAVSLDATGLAEKTAGHVHLWERGRP